MRAVNKHAEVPDAVMFVLTLMASRCKFKSRVMWTAPDAVAAR